VGTRRDAPGLRTLCREKGHFRLDMGWCVRPGEAEGATVRVLLTSGWCPFEAACSPRERADPHGTGVGISAPDVSIFWDEPGRRTVSPQRRADILRLPHPRPRTWPTGTRVHPAPTFLPGTLKEQVAMDRRCLRLRLRAPKSSTSTRRTPFGNAGLMFDNHMYAVPQRATPERPAQACRRRILAAVDAVGTSAEWSTRIRYDMLVAIAAPRLTCPRRAVAWESCA